MIARATISVLAVIALAGCTSAQEQRARQQQRAATEFLSHHGTIGDPGRVAAADLAFARMARDEGTWTAFRAYAAPDAVMDDEGGWSSALEQLRGLPDPAEPIVWAPTTVWSSCDGKLAVSQGKARRPNGIVSTYVSVWELQPDNTYKYIYDTGTDDVPQPAPPAAEDIPEGAIVVPGLTALRGMVADCPGRGNAVAVSPPPLPLYPPSTVFATQLSSDGTLRWTRTLAEDGSRTVNVEWLREGEWQEALDFRIPPPRPAA